MTHLIFSATALDAVAVIFPGSRPFCRPSVCMCICVYVCVCPNFVKLELLPQFFRQATLIGHDANWSLHSFNPGSMLANDIISKTITVIFGYGAFLMKNHQMTFFCLRSPQQQHSNQKWPKITFFSPKSGEHQVILNCPWFKQKNMEVSKMVYVYWEMLGYNNSFTF